MVGRLGDDFGAADVEAVDILEKDAGVIGGDFPGRFFGFAGGFFHFVLAVVGIADQMPHVGDVHAVQKGIAVPQQRAAEQIHENIGAQIADVRVIVYGGAAAVNADRIALKGMEFLLGTGKRVVKFHI